jgi:hypothetical protein
MNQSSGRVKSQVLVGDPLSKGSWNQIFTTSTPGLVLRSTMEEPEDDDTDTEREMMAENALMRIAAREELHPVLFAQSIVHAPFGYQGLVNASLMQQELPLSQVLKGKLQPPQSFDKDFFSSLYSAICAAADLGLCLTDLRPGNVVVDHKGRARLIDLGADYILWMDEVLLMYFVQERQGGRRSPRYFEESGNRQDPRGAICARTRGVQLYLMLLLMYRHLQGYWQYPRGQRLAEQLRWVLSRSCVPLQALVSMQKHSELLQKLKDRIKHYFELDLKTFLIDYVRFYGLIEPNCTGKGFEVTINGKSYQDDTVTCRPGQSARRIGLQEFFDREYPCRTSPSLRRYAVEEDGQPVLMQRRTGKGFGKGSGKSWDVKIPLVVKGMSLFWNR